FRALRGVPWKAAAHITGGGLVENPPRVFKDDTLAVEFDTKTWEVPAIMKLIASAGVAEDEMRRTFNMGLGRIIVVAPDGRLEIAGARVVGRIVPRAGGEPSRFL